MIIEHLCDHREVITELAEWYIAVWPPYYGDTGPGDARADLEARCNRDALPVGLVAMENGKVVATAALGLDQSTQLTPSIIGVLVGHGHRGRGVATALIEACVDAARRLGHRQLYISTSVLGPLLERTGWQETGEARFLNGQPGSIYVRDL